MSLPADIRPLERAYGDYMRSAEGAGSVQAPIVQHLVIAVADALRAREKERETVAALAAIPSPEMPHVFRHVDPDAKCPSDGFPAWAHDPALAVMHEWSIPSPEIERLEPDERFVRLATAVMQLRDFLALHRKATGRSDVNIRKVLALLDEVLRDEPAAYAADVKELEAAIEADIQQAATGGPDFTPKEWPERRPTP